MMDGSQQRSPRLAINQANAGARARGNSAFSLIELLAVVAILLVLVTLYWGGDPTGGSQKQVRANCQKNLQKIYVSLEIFANDNAGNYPLVPGASRAEGPLDLLIPKYAADPTIFVCPGTGDTPLNRRMSYAYYMGRSQKSGSEPLMSDAQVDDQGRSSGQFIFSNDGKPPGNNHKKLGGNFLFCDGEIKAVSPRAPFPIVLKEGVVLLNP